MLEVGLMLVAMAIVGTAVLVDDVSSGRAAQRRAKRRVQRARTEAQQRRAYWGR